MHVMLLIYAKYIKTLRGHMKIVQILTTVYILI